jgi:hypothetical protein
MVFGAAAVLGFVVFFFAATVFFLVVFFAADFFAGAFLAGAGAVALGLLVLGLVVELCACAVTNGTVDVPTNASRANAEIIAFILGTPKFLVVRAGGRCRTCPGRTFDRLQYARNTNMFRSIGDKFRAPMRRIRARHDASSRVPRSRRCTMSRSLS